MDISTIKPGSYRMEVYRVGVGAFNTILPEIQSYSKDAATGKYFPIVGIDGRISNVEKFTPPELPLVKPLESSDIRLSETRVIVPYDRNFFFHPDESVVLEVPPSPLRKLPSRETAVKIPISSRLVTFIREHEDKYRYDGGKLVVKGEMEIVERNALMRIYNSSLSDQKEIDSLFSRSMGVKVIPALWDERWRFGISNPVKDLKHSILGVNRASSHIGEIFKGLSLGTIVPTISNDDTSKLVETDPSEQLWLDLVDRGKFVYFTQGIFAVVELPSVERRYGIFSNYDRAATLLSPGLYVLTSQMSYWPFERESRGDLFLMDDIASQIRQFCIRKYQLNLKEETTIDHG